MPQKFKLTISYRGTNYHGWQFQTTPTTWRGPLPAKGQSFPTVQDKLQRAIKHIVLHPVDLLGSSRTDAGVHAKGQVAHFSTTMDHIPLDRFRRAINHRLPDDILVRSIEPVPDSFDSIASTISKRYQYCIWNSEDRPPFAADLMWHRWKSINIDHMKEAAAHLVGEKDFTSFCAPGHGRMTTVRNVLSCDVSYHNQKVVISTEGNGYLWNMVRIMVGTIYEVGLGRFKPDDIPRMLAIKDRRCSGITAPAHGLYLQWVKYGDSPSPDAIEDEG